MSLLHSLRDFLELLFDCTKVSLQLLEHPHRQSKLLSNARWGKLCNVTALSNLFDLTQCRSLLCLQSLQMNFGIIGRSNNKFIESLHYHTQTRLGSYEP